jgi:hypothetical protein
MTLKMPPVNAMPPVAMKKEPWVPPIEVFEKISDLAHGYRYYAMCLPGGTQRPITATGDDKEQVIARVQRLLDTGKQT